MSAELIHQMYIAYYQRPADPAGLIYWQDQLNANGGGETGWNAVAAAFANAAESSALYGNQTLAQKISAIYVAAFERAASSDEVAFWEASGFNAAQIGFAIVNGAQNDDLSTVSKKVDYAEAFVAAIDPAGTGVGPFSFQYVDPSLGRDLMDVVTKDSDVSQATVSSQVSTTLPTLNTVNLTSGQDNVTPAPNAADEIFASVGGTAPTLQRTDQINGGSAVDTMNVDLDGNFLLGFSTGHMSGVEVLNLAGTVSSVTPRIFNFAGSSGIQTINVGAANAKIELKGVNDSDIAVNLSGLTSGTFKLDFASGAISGTGSALSFGVTNVGASTGSVSLQADGIIDLTLSSNGNATNYVDLSNGANDITTLGIQGAADLDISNVGTTVTAVDASGLLGDLTLFIDQDDNSNIMASGKTIIGGAGYDILKFDGATNTIKASTSNIEELYFQSAAASVKATGMESLVALTFSGQHANGDVSISGLRSGALTVNAFMSAASPSVQSISAQGALTVNVKASDSSIALSQVQDNTFAFSTPTTDAVAINVGQYASAGGTYTMNSSSSVTVNADDTANFGATIRADKATSVQISGGSGMSTTIDASGAKTVSVISGGSGTITFDNSVLLETVNLDMTGGVVVGSSSKLTGAETLTVSSNKTADLTNVTTNDATNITISGTSATVIYGSHSSAGSDLVMSLSGISGGFSASNIKTTDALTIDAVNTTGSFSVDNLSANGITVTLGSIGSFSGGGTVISEGDITIAGENSQAVDVTIANGTAVGDLTVSLGSGTGQITLSDFETGGNQVINYANSVASATFTTLNASGGITLSYGDNAEMVVGTMTAHKDIVINGVGHTTASADMNLAALDSSGATTISLGSGSVGGAGTFSAGVVEAGTDIVLDGSNFAGDMVTSKLSGSGAVTVSMGTLGSFAITGGVATQSDFILTGNNIAADASANISLTDITAGGNVTVSLIGGVGSGVATAGSIEAAGDLTIDASGFGGELRFNSLSASGSITLNGPASGVFSAGEVNFQGDAVISTGAALAGTTADIQLLTVSGSGAVTISVGAHEGVVSGGTVLGGDVTIAATQSTASLDFSTITASGSLTIAAGTTGDFSGNNIDAVGDFSFTNESNTSKTADITLSSFLTSGDATISLGSGPDGAFTAADATVTGDFIFDAARAKTTIDMATIATTGDFTLALGTGGDFSSTTVDSMGNVTISAAGQASTADVTLTTRLSACGTVTMTVAGATGSTIDLANVNGKALTIDASSYVGALDVHAVTASGAVSITLGSQGDFSASSIVALGAINLDNSLQAAGQSGGIVLNSVSSSGVQTFSLGAGSGTFTAAGIVSLDGVTINASGFGGTIGMNSIIASGAVTITGGVRGEVDISAVAVNGAVTLDLSRGLSGTTTSLQDLSAGGAVSITLGNATGTDVSLSSMNTLGAFTLNASLEQDGAIDVRRVSGSGAATVSLGTGMEYSASSTHTGGNFTLTHAGGSGEINLHNVSAGGNMSVTLGAGSVGLVLAVSSALDIGVDGALTINAANSTQTDAISFNGGFVSASGISIITGTSGDFDGGSAMNSNKGFSLTQSGSGNVTLATTNTISAEATITLAGGHLTVASTSGALTVGGLLTINASEAASASVSHNYITASGLSVTMGSSGTFSADEIISTGASGAGDVTFTLGAGSSDINIRDMSAAGTITFNLGSNSGDLTIASALTTDTGDVIINGAGAKSTIDFTSITGSGVSITLGESTDGAATNEFSGSVINAVNFTLTATEYKDTVDIHIVSASGVTMTMGENQVDYGGSAIITETLNFNANGAGSNFTATVALIDVGNSGWQVLMGEDNKATTLTQLEVSGGGTFTGTKGVDDISVEATHLNSTLNSYSFDLRDDNSADRLRFNLNSSDQSLVTITNFQGSAMDGSTNGDELNLSGGSADAVYATSVGTTTAAALLSTALGESITGSQLATVTNTDGNLSAHYTYNGDFYYFGYNLDGDVNLEQGDVIFKFINGDGNNVNAGDIAGGTAQVT